jgi:hypothetical protein
VAGIVKAYTILTAAGIEAAMSALVFASIRFPDENRWKQTGVQGSISEAIASKCKALSSN